MERLVDLLAQELHMDPVDVRRKNFIPADAFPYTTAGSLTYDSGNYQGSLAKALEMVDYQNLRQKQQQMRQQGRYSVSASPPMWRSAAWLPHPRLVRWASRAACGNRRRCAC